MAELFADFDLERRAPRARPMLRTLAGSIALHTVLLLCMIYVPAVRDALQLAGTLAGLRVIDDPNYKKTDVRERAVLINLADSKFYYPPGYFAVANGEAPAAAAPSPTPVDDVRLVSQYSPPTRTPTPTPTPTPVPAPSVAPSPAATTEMAQNGQAQAAPSASPTASPSASPQTAAEIDKALQAAQQEKFPVVNTAPFTDLLKKGKKMKDAGEIDLAGTLELTVEADRRDDGTLDNVEITGGSASDAKLKELAKEFIAALSESKVLVALKQTRHLRMNLLLDDQRINVRVITEVASVDQAKQLAQGYSLLIAAGQLSKKGHDEEAIFKSLRVTTNEREISLNFSMPRAAASDLLSKLSKKAEAGPSS